MKSSRRDFLKLSATTGAVAWLNATSAIGAIRRLAPSVIGANTAIAGTGLFEAIDLLRELGFQAIEIHPFGVPQPTPGKFPGFEFPNFPEDQKRKFLQSLRGLRHLTTHLPYQGLAFVARDTGVADLAHRQMLGALEATAYCGAELAVAHVTAPKGLSLKEAWPEIIQQFRAWGDIAKKGRFRLAVETGYPVSAAEFVRLIKEINHPWVGCAIDVGHQIWYQEFKERVPQAERSTPAGIRAYNDLMHEIIGALGPKIIHFHVHDIDPADWKEHKPIGYGVIDYPRLVTKLEAINYRGVLVLEIGAPDMRAALADNKQQLERFLGA